MTLKAQPPMRRARQASSAYGSPTPDSSRFGRKRSAVTCACATNNPFQTDNPGAKKNAPTVLLASTCRCPNWINSADQQPHCKTPPYATSGEPQPPPEVDQPVRTIMPTQAAAKSLPSLHLATELVGWSVCQKHTWNSFRARVGGCRAFHGKASQATYLEGAFASSGLGAQAGVDVVQAGDRHGQELGLVGKACISTAAQAGASHTSHACWLIMETEQQRGAPAAAKDMHQLETTGRWAVSLLQSTSARSTPCSLPRWLRTGAC